MIFVFKRISHFNAKLNLLIDKLKILITLKKYIFVNQE